MPDDEYVKNSDATAVGDTVVPLFAEELSVSKHMAAESRVRVSRTTHQRDELVELLLARERVEIERVAIDRPIDAMPQCARRETQSSFLLSRKCWLWNVGLYSKRRCGFAGYTKQNCIRNA